MTAFTEGCGFFTALNDMVLPMDVYSVDLA